MSRISLQISSPLPFTQLVIILIGISIWGSCERTRAKAEVQPLASRASNLCGNGNAAAATKLLDALKLPSYREGIGNAHLRITSGQSEAQIWFDQGLNYLHSFWYLEAYRAFKQVVAIDPNCAMGYWGIAMCQPGFGGDDFSVWQKAVDEAVSLMKTCTPAEKGLIDALHITAYQDLQAAAGRWQRLAENFPNNPEVIAFAAIMLRQVVQTDAESNAVKQLLEEALVHTPEHIGLLHYYVHVMEERPDFRAATEATEKLSVLAPNSAHLVHMPGHLYFLDGEYELAREVFEAAGVLEDSYHREEGIPYSINQNYLHNLHYLSVVHSELGDEEKALEVAERFASVSLRQTTPTDGAAWMYLYEGLILPALVNIRFGNYKPAAEQIGFWLVSPSVPLESELVRTYLSTVQDYCLAMDLVVKGDYNQAIHYANAMVGHMDRYAQTEISGSTESSLATQAYDVMRMLRYELAGWLENMNADAPFDEEFWLAATNAEQQIPYDEPPRLMYPVAESRARLHLARGEPEAARKSLQKALLKRPKSLRIIKMLRTI